MSKDIALKNLQYILVLSAKPRNGCDDSRNRFLLMPNASSLANGHQQKTIERPHGRGFSAWQRPRGSAQDARAPASESCRPVARALPR